MHSKKKIRNPYGLEPNTDGRKNLKKSLHKRACCVREAKLFIGFQMDSENADPALIIIINLLTINR